MPNGDATSELWYSETTHYRELKRLRTMGIQTEPARGNVHWRTPLADKVGDVPAVLDTLLVHA